jgi:hypothetical protein
MRSAATAQVARALGVHPEKWPALQQTAFENYALLLALLPNLARWPAEEKKRLVTIIRAKANSSEPRYARFLQTNAELRRIILQIGSLG